MSGVGHIVLGVLIGAVAVFTFKSWMVIARIERLLRDRGRIADNTRAVARFWEDRVEAPISAPNPSEGQRCE